MSCRFIDITSWNGILLFLNFHFNKLDQKNTLTDDIFPFFTNYLFDVVCAVPFHDDDDDHAREVASDPSCNDDI